MRVQTFIQVCDTFIYVDQYRFHKLIRFTGSRKKTHPLNSKFNIGVWHVKYKF